MALDAGTALERSVLSPHRNDDSYFSLRAITASADLKLRFLRTGAKACCIPITVLLVIAALGPAKWAPRTELGWQIDHIVGLLRNHTGCLLCLAPAVRGWGSTHSRSSTAGRSAVFYASSDS